MFLDIALGHLFFARIIMDIDISDNELIIIFDM